MNRDAFDYRLRAGSDAIDAGASLGEADGMDLNPRYQYVHPRYGEPRPVQGMLDAGAYERAN